MSLLSKLADRMILRPLTGFVDPGDNRRELIESSDGIEIEAWVSTWGDFESAKPDQRLVVLKIPGTSGRAERASVHPCEVIINENSHSPFSSAKVWTLNHRGYGGSTGPASLQNFVATLEHIWAFIEKQFPNEKKLVTGNSLGCVSALYLSARKNVDAMLIRNPPPLARLISDRPKFNAWNFGLAKHIARQVPQELDALTNARQSKCPALLITSEKDRVVPIKYQAEIKEAYSGAIKQFVIEGADHHHRVPERQESQYLEAVDWLSSQFTSQNSTKNEAEKG